MTRLPLTLGPIATDGFQLYRSGIRWLYEDGHLCRPDEVIAFCNIVVDRSANLRLGPAPFADERELQIAVAPRVGGRLRIADGLSPGGYLDIVGVLPWDPDTVIGHLETTGPDMTPPPLRLLMLAGRRMSELADIHSGLLPGWHSRARGWWADEPGDMLTMLSLGLCDVTGITRGSRSAFTEMFEATREPTQIVHVPDHPIAPCARTLIDQLTRTPDEHQAIVADLMRGLGDRGTVPGADDLMFAGTLLSALHHSPISEAYEVLTRQGLRHVGPPGVLLLSVNAESGAMLRHKKLGYALHILRHHQSALGPATRAWLRASFEPMPRTADDIKEDYRRLADTVGKSTGARILILNRMSSLAQEDICSYAPFDPPLSAALASVAAKELNLMLHDLADERDVAIVDMDAIAADLGAAEHLPDGIHPSGTMLAVMRSEILHILGAAPAG